MTRLKRRTFLGRSASGALGLAAATIVSGRASRSGRAAPSEKVVIASIGLGGRGGHRAQACHFR